jgi:antitoxin Phd
MTSQVERAMQIWKLQDAKARFSELLETCVAQGPQAVSKRGEVKAVLVPIAEWDRLQAGRRKYTLKELLTSDEFPRFELDIPPRGQMKLREPPEF